MLLDEVIEKPAASGRVTRSDIAHKRRVERHRIGFPKLHYPAIRVCGTLDTQALIGEAKGSVGIANDAVLGLRLAKVLARNGDKVAAKAILESSYDIEQRRLAGVKRVEDRKAQVNHFTPKVIDALCESGELDWARRIAEGTKNNDSAIYQVTRVQSFMRLARGEILFGDKEAGRKILEEMINGRGAASDVPDRSRRTSEQYLPSIVEVALETGELDLAEKAALKSNRGDDIFQATSVFLKGAVAAALYVSNQRERAENMFARAGERLPTANDPTYIVEWYRVAAQLINHEDAAVARVKFPDRQYATFSHDAESMIGDALVEFYASKGAEFSRNMEMAGLAFSSTSAKLAFRTHLKAGRFNSALNYLQETENGQLLHEQEKLWLELAARVYRNPGGMNQSIILKAQDRIVEELDNCRLLGADGKLNSLSLTPLAALHLELGDITSAKEVCSEDFLNDATAATSAHAYCDAVLRVLERRLQEAAPKNKHKVFPFCWFIGGD